jgi:Leucine-rich repeat (LRR) protein
MHSELNSAKTARKQKPCSPECCIVIWLLVGLIPFLAAFHQNPTPCNLTVSLEGKPIFRSLEEALKNPDQVQRLHINRKKLNSIPTEIFRLTNLIELNLAGNKIEVIPDDISKLKNLKSLNIKNNKIHTVSDSLGALMNLEIIDLSKNYIHTLPSQIKKLKNLTCLVIWKNEIGQLPNDMAAINQNLKYLDLRHNPYPPENIKLLRELLPETLILTTRHCACNE